MTSVSVSNQTITLQLGTGETTTLSEGEQAAYRVEGGFLNVYVLDTFVTDIPISSASANLLVTYVPSGNSSGLGRCVDLATLECVPVPVESQSNCEENGLTFVSDIVCRPEALGDPSLQDKVWLRTPITTTASTGCCCSTVNQNGAETSYATIVAAESVCADTVNFGASDSLFISNDFNGNQIVSPAACHNACRPENQAGYRARINSCEGQGYVACSLNQADLTQIVDLPFFDDSINSAQYVCIAPEACGPRGGYWQTAGIGIDGYDINVGSEGTDTVIFRNNWPFDIMVHNATFDGTLFRIKRS